jgi:hypothetical protein
MTPRAGLAGPPAGAILVNGLPMAFLLPAGVDPEALGLAAVPPEAPAGQSPEAAHEDADFGAEMLAECGEPDAEAAP